MKLTVQFQVILPRQMNKYYIQWTNTLSIVTLLIALHGLNLTLEWIYAIQFPRSKLWQRERNWALKPNRINMGSRHFGDSSCALNQFAHLKNKTFQNLNKNWLPEVRVRRDHKSRGSLIDLYVKRYTENVFPSDETYTFCALQLRWFEVSFKPYTWNKFVGL